MSSMRHFNSKDLEFVQIAVYISLAIFLYYCAVGVYRLCFCPIAGFPGPRLAAVTFWYEFYYDIWPHKFQYLWKIKQLHEQYGE